jgi:hypothetical protein
MHKLPPQWINCDLRRFDYSVLGKFHVIMADPPWDIHMSVGLVSFFPSLPVSIDLDTILATIWNDDRRRDAGDANPCSSGRRFTISLGDWQSNGSGA